MIYIHVYIGCLRGPRRLRPLLELVQRFFVLGQAGRVAPKTCDIAHSDLGPARRPSRIQEVGKYLGPGV